MTLSIQIAYAVETTISNKEWFIHYSGREYTVEDGKTTKESGGLKKVFRFKRILLFEANLLHNSFPEQTRLNHWL